MREDDALRAVRAAIDMRSALGEVNDQLESRWGVRLRARTGVNTGEVIAGRLLGRGQAFATGDAVNVAARLERPRASARSSSASTRRSSSAKRSGRAGRPLDLRGRASPCPRSGSSAWPARAAARAEMARRCGPRGELGQLREAFERSRVGARLRLVTVMGAAGMGKSRLIDDFADGCGTPRWSPVRCLSYGEGLTFWPLREIVAELAGIDDGDSPDEAQAAIARAASRGRRPRDDRRAARGALGLRTPRPLPAETFWAVRQLLEAAAAERPLVSSSRTSTGASPPSST